MSRVADVLLVAELALALFLILPAAATPFL